MKFLNLIICFMLIVAPLSGYSAEAPEKIQKDVLQLGKYGSSLNKSLTFDTADGASNKKIELNGTTKAMTINTGVTVDTLTSVGTLKTQGTAIVEGALTLGAGVSADKQITVNRGGSNPYIKWDSAEGKWKFSNDGSVVKKLGSGSGGGGGSGAIQLMKNSGYEDGPLTEAICSSCSATSDNAVVLASENNEKSAKVTFAASTGSYRADFAVSSEFQNTTAGTGHWIKTDQAGLRYWYRIDGVDIAYKDISSDNTWHFYEHFFTSASNSIGYKVEATSAITGSFYIDEGFVGVLKHWYAVISDQNKIGEMIWNFGESPQGFIPASNKSIGISGSGADYTGDAYYELYAKLWALPGISTTAGDPVRISSAKGVSASADWVANKKITLDFETNEIFVRQKGSSRNLGSYQADEFKAHSHDLQGGSGGVANDATKNPMVAGPTTFVSLTNNRWNGAIAMSGGVSMTGTETRPKNIAMNAHIRYSIAGTGIVADTGYALRAGQVITTSSASCPAGTVSADGASYLKADPLYSKLYAAIGATYGSVDSTHFNVPDYRWSSHRGYGQNLAATGSGTASSSNGTFTSHGYIRTGTRVRLTSGTLSGLAASTDYYLIVVDANTLAFATTYANALAGTKIAITGANSGVISQWEDPDASSRLATVGGSSTFGSRQEDGFKSHTHVMNAVDLGGGFAGGGNRLLNYQAGGTVSATGGNQTNDRNVYVNYCIQLYDTQIVGSFKQVDDLDAKVSQKVTNVSGLTYTVLSTDKTLYSNSASAATLTLPLASSVTGQVFKIVATGAGVVTVNTTSSELTDNGVSTFKVSGSSGVSDAVTIQSSGTGWIFLDNTGIRNTSCKVNNNGTASIDTGSGLCAMWVSSVSRPSLGNVVMTLPSGIFSSVPVCEATGDGGFALSGAKIVVTSTTSLNPTAMANSTTGLDAPLYVSCQGKR